MYEASHKTLSNFSETVKNINAVTKSGKIGCML